MTAATPMRIFRSMVSPPRRTLLFSDPKQKRVELGSAEPPARFQAHGRGSVVSQNAFELGREGAEAIVAMSVESDLSPAEWTVRRAFRNWLAPQEVARLDD